MTDTTQTTDTAAPVAAPASESTPTNTEPSQATPASADVYGSSSATETTATPQNAPMGQTEASGGIINQLYTSEGGLAENYTDLLRENGMENLTNTIQKYKSADGLLKGAANLVNFAGKKVTGTIVPNEGSSPEEVAEYHKAIGVPESATAYDLKPENMAEGLGWDDGLAGEWQNVFHEAGVTQAQAQALSQAYSDITNTQLEQANQTLASNAEAEMAEQQRFMKKQWGANYDSNMQSAVDMAQVVGFDLENQGDMTALRNPKVLDLLLAKSSSMQEGTLPRSGTPANANYQSPQATADKIFAKHNGKIQFAPIEEQKAYQEARKLQFQQSKQFSAQNATVVVFCVHGCCGNL